MKFDRLQKSRLPVPAALTALGALIVASCGGGGSTLDGSTTSVASQQAATVFSDTALVVDKSEVVASSNAVDANLQNPWGIAVAMVQ